MCGLSNQVRTQFNRYYLNTFWTSTLFSAQTDIVIAQNTFLNGAYKLTGENYHGDVTEYKPICIGNYIK